MRISLMVSQRITRRTALVHLLSFSPIVVGLGCRGPTGHSAPQNRGPDALPTMVEGVDIVGIQSRFEVASFDPQSTVINGAFHLANQTHSDVSLPVFTDALQHMRVMESANGRVARTSSGWAWINPGVSIINIGANSQLKRHFNVRLKDRFIVPSNSFLIGFIYDVRLLDMRQSIDSPFVDWSSRPICLAGAAQI